MQKIEGKQIYLRPITMEDTARDSFVAESGSRPA